jgi:C4-dicarboxylate transporter, DctM subunit
MLTFCIFMTLLVLILIDLPIAVAMGLTAVIFFFVTGNEMNLVMMAQRMYAATTGYVLLAIPFFILAGNLLNRGGTTTRIFKFCKALVGHVSGGLGHVCVLANMIFSGMSGSAVADAAGLGQILYKSMKDNGYRPAFAGSIVAAAATIGPVIPPSIPFVIFGALTGVSVSKLFLAGFIPGILMGIAMMIAIWFIAKIGNLPKAPKATFKEVLSTIKDSFLPLMAPVIIIGGILTGLFTPTEASVVLCIYAVFLGFLYKDLKFKDLPDIFWQSIKQTVSLMFIMASAGLFGWLTIYQKIPDQIIASLVSMTASPKVVLAVIMAISIVLGCFLEGNAIFFITIPIFLPICQQFGIDLVNFGVVMTLLIMIGNIHPPVGMCLFAVSSFSNLTMMQLTKEIWPYIVGIALVTIILAYVPAISTWLPYLVMGK